MKSEAVVAILASEGLAQVAVGCYYFLFFLKTLLLLFFN